MANAMPHPTFWNMVIMWLVTTASGFPTRTLAVCHTMGPPHLVSLTYGGVQLKRPYATKPLGARFEVVHCK